MFRKKEPPIQPELWVPASNVSRGSAAPFWNVFDALLEELDFPEQTRAFCAPYHAHSDRGYPGIDPVVLFKMLLTGFFENLPSEPAIASRCEDSFSIRGLLGSDVTEDTVDHSISSRFRDLPGRTTSSREWEHSHDPGAKVGPTKHGEVGMIYKPEHSVDMESGAILDTRALTGDQANCVNIAEHIIAAERRVAAVIMSEGMDVPVETVTNHGGYYSTSAINDLSEIIPRVNIPERKKERNLDTLTDEQREAVLAASVVNASGEGNKLLRKPGVHVERSFAHVLDCGGMRRTTLHGEESIQIRYNIAAFVNNLSLLMCILHGRGTLKQWLTGAKHSCFSLFPGILALMVSVVVPQCLHPRLRTAALVGLGI